MQHVQQMVALGHIKPHPHNTRTHSKKQIRRIADSIQAVGFTSPVLIDEQGVLLAGHGRLEAAKLLGLKTIPAIVIAGLSEARKRALLLADNRIAQSAGWDRERRRRRLRRGQQVFVAGACRPQLRFLCAQQCHLERHAWLQGAVR
jgi:ParB-like chromosome segregation protein Spo0J